MVDSIPKIVEKLWDIWNIRLVILFSLFLQTVLILLSPNRKRSSSQILVFIIWSGYLLADATANYAVGLISSNNQCSDLSNNDRDLLVLWSAFLIVHLGGPDTITAFALEDNELWLRHFLTLVFQAVTTIYVFLQSLPENKLTIPMILLFVSGCIKYLERTRSLYLASGDRIPSARGSYFSFLGTHRHFDLIIESLSGQVDDLQLVRAAYRGNFINLVSSSIEFDDELNFFKDIRATTALRLLEVELNFLYDILFTKTTVVHSSMGFFFRFFSFCCIITSLAVFHFHITKHGVFNGINVAVTYVLFLGAVALELIAFLMVVLSDWTVDAMIESEESSDQNWWRKIVAQISNFVHPAFRKIWSYWTPHWYLEEDKGAQPEDQELRVPLLFRRSSGCLLGHNLIRYCLKGQPSGIPIVKAMNWVIDRVGLGDLLDKMTCLSRKPLRKNLWNLIFQQLKGKSPYRAHTRFDVFERSDLDRELCENLRRYMDRSHEESLLLWHVATELLYNDKQDPANDFSINNSGLQIRVGTKSDVDPRGYVEMSKTLSDYMLYLVIMQPNIMPAVGDIGKTRFLDTCAVAKKFFVKKNLRPSQQVRACECILEEKAELEPVSEDFCALPEASQLAQELRGLGDKKWEFISQVWVELLCFAAFHSRGKAHAQQLSKGGELITFVWLLMTHFRIAYP